MGSVAIIRVTFDSKSIISRQGTAVSPVAPVTFLYGINYIYLVCSP